MCQCGIWDKIQTEVCEIILGVTERNQEEIMAKGRVKERELVRK
jgi:hypothetical protein